MKGLVAVSFILLVVAGDRAVVAKPGGYTASNDVVAVQFDDAKWGDARRAGEQVFTYYKKKPANLAACLFHANSVSFAIFP
jgi:hypothetical protein